MVVLCDCAGWGRLAVPVDMDRPFTAGQWYLSRRRCQCLLLDTACWMGDPVGARDLGCGPSLLVANNAGIPQELQACGARCPEVFWRALR